MNVIPFRRERSRHQFAPPVEPPAALSRERSRANHSPNEDDFEDRRRMQQNLAAFRASIHEFCSRRGVTYIFTSNQVPFDRLVLTYLRQRGLVR